MLELAEDEQLAFIEAQKAKVFKDLTPVEKPEYIALIGAKGAGKSVLSRNLKNTAVISPDTIIADYIESFEIDGEKDFYDKSIGLFATEVVNALLLEAVHQGYNVANDTGLTANTKNIMNKMEKCGYKVKIKAVMADDLQAQINVVKRKLEFDEQLIAYKNRKAPYPSDRNPLQASIELSARSSFDVIDFLKESTVLGRDFEVYEYGKSRPSYNTKKSKISFDEYLDGFVEKLPVADVYKRENDKLIKQARRQGNAELEMQLINFRNNNFGGR